MAGRSARRSAGAVDDRLLCLERASGACAFRPPERYALDTSAYPTIKEAGLKTFHGYLKDIDGMLAGRQWLGDQYSVLDPYAFVFYTWGIRRELPMGELKNYTAFKDRMLQRPAVQRVVADEKVKV